MIFQNGLISSLPYLICWIWSLFIAWIADKLISSKKVSRAYVRKGTTIFAFIGAAAGLFGITFIGCNPTWAIILLCFAIAIEGTGYSGYMVNQLELSPNYAGTLKGASSTIANICGFVTPAIVGALTFETQTLAAWNNVFYVSVVLYFIGCLTFVLFGDTSIQSWNTYWINDSNDETVPLLITQ